MKTILLMSSLFLAAGCVPVPPPPQIGGPIQCRRKMTNAGLRFTRL